MTGVQTCALPIWALQDAEGKVGSLGRFLAGPWGAAISIAATAIGPFIANLFKSSDATEKLEEAQKAGQKAMDSYGTSMQTLKSLQEEYAIMTAKNIQQEIILRQQYYNSAKAALDAANDKVTALTLELNAKKAAYYAAKKMHEDSIGNAVEMGNAEAAAGLQILGGRDASKKYSAAIIVENSLREASAA